jgi:LmbE family N-acetylglucosaminyl deacetylase
MRILCVGAHPADCYDLSGGTLYHHSKRGDEIVAMAVTDGIYSHGSDETSETYRMLKRKEFTKASEMLAVTDVLFGGFMDEPLIVTKELVDDLTRVIRAYKPDVVITHHPNEYAHFDHASCGKAVCRALKASIKRPGEKHFVPTVYFFGVQFRPENARVGYTPQPPDVLVDISDVVEEKIKMMRCFRSQGHDNVRMLRQRMDSFESEMGRADGLRYSEGFILYYPLKTRLLYSNPDVGL